jgi:glycosyltransferase involved in cell wall biosynthesis
MTRRITVVTSEVLGVPGAGGPGTADSLLALALGRRGHEVDLLIAPGRDITAFDPEWEHTYASSNVHLHPLSYDTAVQPSFLAPTWHVHAALRRDAPDVVIADDWRALAYAALRSRQLGVSLGDTAFVLYCHGPARVLAEAARKVPDTVARYGEELAQRACLELADAAVSPSEWLVGWLRDHGWAATENARVIQNLWASVALERPAPRAETGVPIRRLAFFGQLREGKGIRILLDSLKRLDRDLLGGVELVFLGHTRQWTLSGLSEELGDLSGRLASIRVETSLDRTGAIKELLQPGTLALMPSLLENSPYAVAECVEHGIPFLATDVGGTSELVAAEDRGRVLHRLSTEDFASALTSALRSSSGIEPARPARKPEESLVDWLELVEKVEPRSRPATTPAQRVAVVACGAESVARAEALARSTQSTGVDVVPATARSDGLARASADWVMFLDEDDVPDDGLLDALVAAQASSGADAVTSGVRTPAGVHLFLGDPGALGLIENQYGVIGLIRRSLASSGSDWLLFAGLALGEGRIVSIPDPLSTFGGRIATVGDVPGDGVEILRAWETARPAQDGGLAQLAATLAAGLMHTAKPVGDQGGTLMRGIGRLRSRAGRRRG